MAGKQTKAGSEKCNLTHKDRTNKINQETTELKNPTIDSDIET